MEIREVAVIGLGTMGAGIAEVFARNDYSVTGIELNPDALSHGLASLDASLGKAVTRGKLAPERHMEIFGRIRPATSLADAADADLVIEVVPERIGIKHEILAELDELCRAGAIIATNTSSLSVTAIAAGSAHPGRVLGMHFFNPAPVMRLVEVVTTILTEPGVADTVTDLARRLGKTPVLVTDRAGFVANALLLPYLNHAVRLLETGRATREDIDLAVTEGIGLPMGPLALLDLIGLDTSLSVMDVLAAEFGGSRYTPAPMLRRLAAAGRTGRKAGGGFYDYGVKEASNKENEPSVKDLSVVVVSSGATQERAAALATALTSAGTEVITDLGGPADLVLIATGPEGGVLAPALAVGRPADTVGVHLASPTLAELVPTSRTTPEALARAEAVVAGLGARIVRSADRPGLIVGGLLAAHLRDAVAMVDDGYATPDDVEAAMTLGCGYPKGPFQLLAERGPAEIESVLRLLHAATGDAAFGPEPLLAEYALAGIARSAPGALAAPLGRRGAGGQGAGGQGAGGQGARVGWPGGGA